MKILKLPINSTRLQTVYNVYNLIYNGYNGKQFYYLDFTIHNFRQLHSDKSAFKNKLKT